VSLRAGNRSNMWIKLRRERCHALSEIVERLRDVDEISSVILAAAQLGFGGGFVQKG